MIRLPVYSFLAFVILYLSCSGEKSIELTQKESGPSEERNGDSIEASEAKKIRKVDSGEKNSSSLTEFPEKLVQPFTITRSADLRRVADRVYPAVWTDQNPGHYVNETGRTLSLVSMHAYIDGYPYGPTPAAGDVCLMIMLPGIDTITTITHSERLCVGMGKTSHRWPESDFKIKFPGRGHIVPPGAVVFCNSQATALVPTNQEVLSKFACVLELRDAQIEKDKPLVQAIRVPFLDESFRSNNSRTTKQTNLMEGKVFRTHGVWAYANTGGRPGSNCFYWNPGNGQDQKACWPVGGTTGDWITQLSFQPFAETMAYGHQFTAACELGAGSDVKKYCAYFLMVEVLSEDIPIYPRHTVEAGQRQAFCSNLDDGNFELSDRTAIDRCASLLSQ